MVGGTRFGFFLVDIEEIGVGARHTITVNAAAGQIRGRNCRLAGLIDITEAEQIGAASPDVSDLHHGPIADFMLQVQIEVLYIGGAEIRIGAEEVSQRRGSAEYGLSGGDGIAAEPRR